MALGLLINSGFDSQVVPFPHLLPVVAFWAVMNMLLLLLVAKIAITPPLLRSEERFELQEQLRLHLAEDILPAESRDMSLSGVRLHVAGHATAGLDVDEWCGVEIGGVGTIPARIRRSSALGEGAILSLSFVLPTAGSTAPEGGAPAEAIHLRRQLIRKLYTVDRARKFNEENGWEIGFRMLTSILTQEPTTPEMRGTASAQSAAETPSWLLARCTASEAELDAEWEQVLAERATDTDGSTRPAA
jgi:cellulose synthase (UDP-forming)